MPEVCAALAIAAELGLGLLLLVGWQTRWAALGLAIFVAVITPLFHNYWAVPEAQVMMQKQAFFKNYASVGGLLVLAAFGGGAFSLDGRRRLADALAAPLPGPSRRRLPLRLRPYAAHGAGRRRGGRRAADRHRRRRQPAGGGWDRLKAADAIIFGSPTYMGSVSWQFKKFADASSRPGTHRNGRTRSLPASPTAPA